MRNRLKLHLFTGIVLTVSYDSIGQAQTSSPTPSPTPSPSLAVVSRVRTPLKLSELPHERGARPGKSLIRVEKPATPYDLDVRIWKVAGAYNLELEFEISRTDAEILPVDDYGRLKSDFKKTLHEPFIRFTMPDGSTRLISFGCEKTRCRGLWPRFPYKEGQPAEIKVDVNVRGLTNHGWRFKYNQVQPERQVVKIERETIRLEGSDAFEATNLYRKNAYTPPGAAGPREPATIDEWRFSVPEKLTATGYHRLGTTTLYEIHEGPIVFDVTTDGTSLESIELQTRDRLWLGTGVIVALKAPRGGRVLRLEF